MRPVTLEDYLRLDVRFLARNGYLKPGSCKRIGWMVQGDLLGTVTVCVGGDVVDIIGDTGHTKNLSQSVQLDRTACPFGNTRSWFFCPECYRRCAILYLDQDLRCRVCLSVPYLTDVLGKRMRQQDRREKAAQRIGLDRRSGKVVRPRYMHLDTWLRHWKEHEAAEAAILADIRDWIDNCPWADG